MLVLKAKDKTSEEEIKNNLDKLSNSYEVVALDLDKKGAFII